MDAGGSGDFDGDGDLDILAGNFGANNKLQPTPEEPLRMYVNDFDDNESIDQILTYYVKGVEIPFANHAELTKQLPPLKKKYIFAQDMAREDLPTLFGREKLAGARQYEVTTLESTLFEQQPDGSFVGRPLPDRAQFSTVHATAAFTTADGQSAALIGGNFLGANIEMGWYDAGRVRAVVFDNDGKMAVREIGGAPIMGEVRNIVPITIGGERAFLVGRNDDTVRVVGTLTPRPPTLTPRPPLPGRGGKVVGKLTHCKVPVKFCGYTAALQHVDISGLLSSPPFDRFVDTIEFSYPKI